MNIIIQHSADKNTSSQQSESGRQIKFHNEELHNVYFSPDIVWMIKYGR
jgi:hypothetical protein